MNRYFIFHYPGKAILATVVCGLFVVSTMAQTREIDYSRIKATGTSRHSYVKIAQPDTTRKTKPSVLIIKAFAVDISKPLASAVAKITSKATGKTQVFPLPNGQLDFVFNGPDAVSIEVSGEGYTSANRSMTIAVSPTGNRYEFDAQLDPAPIKLTVWAVDSQTKKVIHDAHFTISGKITLLLDPDTTSGLAKAELPGKGVYLLSSSANGYGNFTKSIKLDSAQNEARVILSPKKMPNFSDSQALPEAVVKSARSMPVDAAAVQPAVKAPVLKTAMRLPSLTDRPFKTIEKGKPVQLKNVYFDQSSPVLRPESFLELDQLVAMLVENPSVQLEIRGHTDNQGDFDLNIKLARDRCQAVIDYLVSKGIAKSRLKAVGRGPIDPVAPNNNEDNRKKNRRVEFVVV